MKRRRFLQSAVGVVPLAFSGSLLMAESGSVPSEVHALKIGEDVDGLPLQRPGSTLAFKVTPQETGGRLLMVEHTNLVRGGPPLHKHLEQEEWFRVEEGQVLFQVGEKRVQLGPGESLLAPRMIPHTFTHVGDKPVRLLIAFSPAGRMEEFFRDAQKVPFDKQDATFYQKYDMVFLGPPLTGIV